MQTIVPGMSLQEKQAQTTAGTVQGQTLAGLLPLQTQTQQALQIVDQLQNHPGQKLALGAASKFPVIPARNQANFLALLEQAKSGVFRHVRPCVASDLSIPKVQVELTWLDLDARKPRRI